MDLLSTHGIIFDAETNWAGCVRVLDGPPGLLDELKQQPGAFSIQTDNNGVKPGLYIPRRLLSIGVKPGVLEEYPPEPYNVTPTGLQLKEHQLRAVTFVRSVQKENMGCIVGADPGLGKTLVTLQALWLDGYLQGKGLVLGPSQASGTWTGERSDPFVHYGLWIQPLHTKTPNHEELLKFNWYFIHYEIAEAWANYIREFVKPSIVIIDESHQIMNQTSQRGKVAKVLTAGSHIVKRIALSGTPIPKTRLDLYNQLAVIQPNQWGPSKHSFGVRWCGGQQILRDDGGANWDYSGESHTTELRSHLCGVYLRYEKTQVATSLSELKREVVDLKGRMNLDKYWNTQISAARASKGITSTGLEDFVDIKINRATQLKVIGRLIAELEMAKLPVAADMIIKLMQGIDKCVIFCYQRKAASKLFKILNGVQGFRTFGPATGQLEFSKRLEVAKEFYVYNGKACIVCTMGGLGIALNDLRCASHVIQVSLSWNPSDCAQVESRVHREGNPHPVVTSIYLVARGTIDDMFIDALERKALESAAITPHIKDGLNLIGGLTSLEDRAKSSLDDVCKIFDTLDE